mgnify:CR=1 FL=1
MKKRGFLLVALLAMGILACGKKASTAESSAAATTAEVKTGQEGEDKESKAATEAAKESTTVEAKGKEEGGKEKKDLTVITGTITDAAMNSVSIKGNDGKDYELNKIDKSDISGLSQGIEIGTKVEVIFDKDMNILSMVDPGK